MYENIIQKRDQLLRAIPSGPEFASWLEESDLWCWLYSCFRITGRPVSKKTVVSMLSGEIIEDVPLNLFAFASDLRSIHADMKSYLLMQAVPDRRMLNRWAAKLLGKDDRDPSKELYRQNNPVVYDWDLVPAHFRSIHEELDALMKKYSRLSDDPVLSVCRLHLEINKLYPYGEDTATVAFAAVLYQLMRLRLPVPELSIDTEEYNRLVAEYIKKGDISGFAEMFAKSLNERIDAVRSIALQAGGK